MDDEDTGPHCCQRCCSGTWNDDDICDDCREEAEEEDDTCQ